MSAIGGGAVYDRGYRPYEGPRGGRRAATVALVQGVDAPSAGPPPAVAAEGRPVRAARHRHHPGHRQRRHRLRHPRQSSTAIEIITYRDYVGVSSALLLFVALVAPDVMCPDRRQRVLPLMFARPLTGVDYVAAKAGAIATILFAFSFLPQVVLFVGNMLVSDSALDYFTRPPRRAVEGAARRALLAVYYAVIGVAFSSLTDRRIVAGAAVIGLFLVTSIASGVLVGDVAASDDGSPAALINVLGLPLYLRDSSSWATSTRTRPSTASPTAGCSRSPSTSSCWPAAIGMLLRRYRWVER